MKLYDRTKWIIIFAGLAVLAFTGKLAENFVAGKLYMQGSYIGSAFEDILPIVPLLLCSFAGAVMMLCRNTRGSRNKNRFLTLLCGIVSYAFAFAAAYYPFRNIENADKLIIAVIALAIMGSLVFVCYSSFKYTYQKEIMMGFAVRTIISMLLIIGVCLVARLLPMRNCYEAIRQNMLQTGSTDGPFVQKIPLIPFITAGTPVLMNIFFFKDAVPKLKFSDKMLFIVPCLWIVFVIFGIQTAGTVYLSEAVYGAVAGCVIVLLTSEITKKIES